MGSSWELWTVAGNYGQWLGITGNVQELWAVAGNYGHVLFSNW